MPSDRRRRPIHIRIAVVLAGTTIILIGIVISPLPGPGLTILGPVGLALLATEFVWARRLLDEVTNQEKGIRRIADRRLRVVSRLYIIPIVAAFWVGAWSLSNTGIVPDWMVWSMSFAFFMPVAYFCNRIFVVRARRAREVKLGSPTPDPCPLQGDSEAPCSRPLDSLHS